MAVTVPHLPGREHELAALLDLLNAADELPAGAEAAEECGYMVLSCRPSEAEARFSFVGLADLIRTRRSRRVARAAGLFSSGGKDLNLRPPGYEPPRVCRRVPLYSAEMQAPSQFSAAECI